VPSAPCGEQPELRLYFPALTRWVVGKMGQLSSCVPRHVGVAISRLALQAGGPGLPIPGLIRHNARRLGLRNDPQDKERYASVEDYHCAPPFGAGTPVFSRPVATERPAIHVFGLSGLASAIVFTRAVQKQM